MTGAGEWLAEQQAADQRRFVNMLAGSVVVKEDESLMTLDELLRGLR